MEKHCSGTQILKYTHRHIIASALERAGLCVFSRTEMIPGKKTTRVHGYSWSVTDSCWHCTDRSVWLCENSPPCPPHKSHFHVSLNLLKVHVLGEWANDASALVQEKYVVWARHGIPFGAPVIKLPQSGHVCVHEDSCISVCPNLASMCCCSCGSIWAERQTEQRIKILRTSLGTSGYNWQKKRGPVCSGNWQKGLTQPCTTQPNAFQKLPIWWGKK